MLNVHDGVAAGHRFQARFHLKNLRFGEGTLFAVAMDPDRLETRGQPIPALEHVAGSSGLGFGQFAASDDGTIAYLSGQADAGASPVIWADRNGQTSILRSIAVVRAGSSRYRAGRSFRLYGPAASARGQYARCADAAFIKAAASAPRA